MQVGCFTSSCLLSQLRTFTSSHVPCKIHWRSFLGHVFLGWKRGKVGGLRLVLVQVQPWEKWGEGAESARGVFWLPSKGSLLVSGPVQSCEGEKILFNCFFMKLRKSSRWLGCATYLKWKSKLKSASRRRKIKGIESRDCRTLLSSYFCCAEQ